MCGVSRRFFDLCPLFPAKVWLQTPYSPTNTWLNHLKSCVFTSASRTHKVLKTKGLAESPCRPPLAKKNAHKPSFLVAKMACLGPLQPPTPLKSLSSVCRHRYMGLAEEGVKQLSTRFRTIRLNQKNSREGWNRRFQKTPHGRWRQGPGSVDPRFPAGLPFPVPEILEFVAFRDSGKFFQQFSRDLPRTFPQNSRTNPRNSHSLLEFSD